MACYNNTPLIAGVQYPQPCDCCTDPDCPNPISAKCVYYNGPALPCSGITTGEDLETALQNIEEQICSVIGDYSTYNTYCLAPINTQQEFVEAISQGYCSLKDDFDFFVNTTFVNYQTSVTNQFNAIINPAITCATAGVTNVDTLTTVLNKYCTKMTSLTTYVDISGVTWDCLVPGPITKLEDGFNALVSAICSLSSAGTVLPTFNNIGSCLPSPGAADSLVDTIDKIKTRLCQTPTFDINALTWGCTPKPSTTTTNLQAAFQSVLDGVNDYKQNKLSFSPDFTLTPTNPLDPCAGQTLNLTVPVIGSDRFVASDPGDASPATLIQKLAAGPNITLDIVTNPGQVTITSLADTYKVKADATDLNPDYLIDKITGVTNVVDGIAITDTYDAGSENVLLTPTIDWTTFINKMFDVISVDAALYARFCELACACDCTSTTTTTTTTDCNTCYSYTYGPGIASCTITWTNCDGTPGTSYVGMGASYSVPCMREGSGTGCGPWTKGLACGSWGPGCTTTTTTTSGIAYFDVDPLTVSNELASTGDAFMATNGLTPSTTAAPGSTSLPVSGFETFTIGNSFIITITPVAPGTTVTLISLAGFSAPGSTVVATGSGTGTLTITVTPSSYNGAIYYVYGDIEVGIS